MYRLRPEAQNVEPIPGVPWRDMDDDEFAEVSERYDVQFEEKGSLERWFEHEKKKRGGEAR